MRYCESGRECLNLQDAARFRGRTESIRALYAEAERWRNEGAGRKAAVFAEAASYLELMKWPEGETEAP